MDTDTGVIERLTALQGFLPAVGLKNCSGNRTLYLEILRKFVDYYATGAPVYARSIDREQARAVTHSLHGVCVTLGITGLTDRVASIRGHLAHGVQPDAIAEELAAINELLVQLCVALREVIEGEPAR